MKSNNLPSPLIYTQELHQAGESSSEHRSSVTLTYAVHAAQPREGSGRHLLDTVFVDPQLNQGSGQVLGDRSQQILGEIKLLHVLEGQKCFGVDFVNQVIPQGESLEKEQ